jgi:hypothetical protein
VVASRGHPETLKWVRSVTGFRGALNRCFARLF